MLDMLYHSPSNSRIRVTISGRYQNGYLELAASRCGQGDSFNRKLGVTIATGRLNKDRIIRRINHPANASGQFFLEHARQLAKEIAENPELVHP